MRATVSIKKNKMDGRVVLFRMFLFALVGVMLAFASGCGGGGGSSTPTTPTQPAATVNSVTVSGSTSNLTGKGQTCQLKATANMSNQTTQDVTSQATWQSDNSGIASVSSGGLVTAVGNGEATITAAYSGKNGTLKMKVELPQKGIPEWEITLSCKIVNAPNGKYSAKTNYKWTEKGGVYGISLDSLLMRYLDDSKTQFQTQSWTANAIKQAWGGSNRISPGGSKDWEINYPFNNAVTTLTIEYTCTIMDDLGNSTTLTATKSVPVT